MGSCIVESVNKVGKYELLHTGADWFYPIDSQGA